MSKTGANRFFSCPTRNLFSPNSRVRTRPPFYSSFDGTAVCNLILSALTSHRTKQSPCWNEARAYCDLPGHRLAPNCRIVNAIVKETNPAEDEEALALVREALQEQDQRRERKAGEGLGFGGVIRRESQASASTRRESTARSRFHARCE